MAKYKISIVKRHVTEKIFAIYVTKDYNLYIIKCSFKLVFKKQPDQNK